MKTFSHEQAIEEKTSMKGHYLFRIHAPLSIVHEGKIAQLSRVRFGDKDIFGRVKREYEYENLLPTVGRQMIANNLTSNAPTNTMLTTHCALGSNVTAPANGDTQLGTETYRNTVSSRTNASNIAYITGFFSTSETSGTYKECGIFSNGTGTANSGVLLSHVAINITKSTSETMTLQWTLTIN